MFQLCKNKIETVEPLSFNDVPQYAGCPYPVYVRHHVFEFYGVPKWPITRITTTFRKGWGFCADKKEFDKTPCKGAQKIIKVNKQSV